MEIKLYQEDLDRMIVRLFVRNLHYKTEEDELREVFKEVGIPTVVNIITHRDTGKPRGFGFVTLDTLDQSGDCWRATLQGRKIRGRPMHIDYSIPKDSREAIRQ